MLAGLDKKELVLIGSFTLWSVSLPFMPKLIFDMVDTLIGALCLILILLYCVSLGTIPTVLGFIAVALTFVERNKRKIRSALLNDTSSVKEVTLEEQLAAAPPLSPNEIHPEYDSYSEDTSVSFIPKEDNGDNTFEGMGNSSIDEKTAIPTISPNSSTAEKYFVRNDFGKTTLEGS